MFDRRSVVVSGLGALAAASLYPRMAWAAAPTDRRFVFIIQRGAADGLHIVAPLGDPAYAGLRGPLLAGLEGARKLDGMFSLHPALAKVGEMFGNKQALAVHAVASAYRDRSHFDGQNVLETGARLAYSEKSGWMNRLIALLPQSDSKALALTPEVPMALRGPRTVASYAPSRLTPASDDLLLRVGRLYAEDAQLSTLWQSAMATRSMAGNTQATAQQSPAETGRMAASLMTPTDGARLMMIETGGWDTHSGQQGRLNAQLRQLDMLVDALATGLGPAWQQTLVLIATEFGRTAQINGTQGTDHGTASAVLLMGGSLRGGRVVADWPGLNQSALYEGRDLKPTMAMEALIAGVLAGHFGLDPQATANGLYPDQPGVRPVLV